MDDFIFLVLSSEAFKNIWNFTIMCTFQSRGLSKLKFWVNLDKQFF